MKRFYDSFENELTQEEYLYGKYAEVPDIPADVIMRRIELLDDNLRELFSKEIMHRESARITAVLKAKNFWLKINEAEL